MPGGLGRPDRDPGPAQPDPEPGPDLQAELERTFKKRIGIIDIVEAARAAEAIEILKEAGEDPCELGSIERGDGTPHVVFY